MLKLNQQMTVCSYVQVALFDQKVMLTASLKAIDGQLEHLLAGQKAILEQLYSLHDEVRTGVATIHDQLLAMRDNQFRRQKFAQLEELYCDVLRRMGTLHLSCPHCQQMGCYRHILLGDSAI